MELLESIVKNTYMELLTLENGRDIFFETDEGSE